MEITDEDSKLLMNHFPYYTMVGMPRDADHYCFRQDVYCFPSLNFILKCKQMMPIEPNKEKDYTINEIESTQLDYDNAKDFLENVIKISLKREAIDQQIIQLLQKPKNIIAIDELSHKPKSIIDIIDKEQIQKESKKSSYDDILAPIELLVIFFFIAIIYFTII